MKDLYLTHLFKGLFRVIIRVINNKNNLYVDIFI